MLAGTSRNRDTPAARYSDLGELKFGHFFGYKRGYHVAALIAFRNLRGHETGTPLNLPASALTHQRISHHDHFDIAFLQIVRVCVFLSFEPTSLQRR
jgi:hypothetical protein